MEIILTLKEAVYMKGNQNQIKTINEKGRLPTNQLKAILTRFEEEYESVTVEGKGKNKIVILRNKRAEPVRILNVGKGENVKSPMIEPLKTLVAMKMLENNHNKKGCFHFPVSRLMEEFEVADKRFCYHRTNINPHLNKLESADIHKDISEDVLNSLHSSFSSAIFGVFKQLKKDGLAKWYMLPYAKFYKTEVAKTPDDGAVEIDGQVSIDTTEEWYAPLDVNIAKEIDDKLKILEERMGINYWIAKKGFHSKAKDFISEYKKIHASYGIRYKYDAYCAYLTKGEEKVRAKLALPETPDEAKLVFDSVARKYNLTLAERRQTKGFGKVGKAVHQAKIDGTYAPKAKVIYGYMVDGEDMPI
jgi:hypothetical protein